MRKPYIFDADFFANAIRTQRHGKSFMALVLFVHWLGARRATQVSETPGHIFVALSEEGSETLSLRGAHLARPMGDVRRAHAKDPKRGSEKPFAHLFAAGLFSLSWLTALQPPLLPLAQEDKREAGPAGSSPSPWALC